MTSVAALAALVLLSTGPALAQAEPGPMEWRETRMSPPNLYGATAFTGETDGVRHATVVLRARGDRTISDGSERVFRGIEVRAEIRCAERMWRIVSMTHYGEDFAVVSRMGEVPEAPLIRETPLHAAITDVCDGGHTGPVGLTTDDPVAVQRWLDGL